MIPDRKTDPLGYALWWLGDLVPVLQAKADAYRLELRSRDVPNVDRAAGLKRLKRLADHRGLLERLPYERRSGRSTAMTSEGLACIVAMNLSEEDHATTHALGLLTHEATHIFQDWAEDIGEEKPSAEFMAYSIQHFTSELINAYQEKFEAMSE